MKDKVTKKATNAFDTAKRIVENAEHLVLALSLVVTAAYNYYDLTIRPVGDVEYTIRIIASVVIVLKGAYETFTFFNKEKTK
jgi:hypothetical protein